MTLAKKLSSIKVFICLRFWVLWFFDNSCPFYLIREASGVIKFNTKNLSYLSSYAIYKSLLSSYFAFSGLNPEQRFKVLFKFFSKSLQSTKRAKEIPGYLENAPSTMFCIFYLIKFLLYWTKKMGRFLFSLRMRLNSNYDDVWWMISGSKKGAFETFTYEFVANIKNKERTIMEAKAFWWENGTIFKKS